MESQKAIFFRPSDIIAKVCTVNNKTKGGSAFAVCEDGDQVFISPKIVNVTGIDSGDLITAYCIDNHKDEDGRDRYSVRWRAIRVTLEEKFVPAPPEAAVAEPVKMTETERNRIRKLMLQNRAWTVRQMTDGVRGDKDRVSKFLMREHQAGRFACARLYSIQDQERASFIYYAKDMELLRDLIDDVVLED
jgi:hypothetical protein